MRLPTLFPTTAVWLSAVLAVGALALAFPGAERAGAFMRTPPMIGVGLALGVVLLAISLRAGIRRRPLSACLHLGLVLIVAGALLDARAAQIAQRHLPRPDATSAERLRARPDSGYLALVDGERSDILWDKSLQRAVGHLPFEIDLRRFEIAYYPPSDEDRAEGRQPPVKTYTSQVVIHGKDKQVAADIRVNQPLTIQGWTIYQMSWGQGRDTMGRPIRYTVLQAIRAPGLPVVYAGFGLVTLGLLAFTVRALRA